MLFGFEADVPKEGPRAGLTELMSRLWLHGMGKASVISDA